MENTGSSSSSTSSLSNSGKHYHHQLSNRLSSKNDRTSSSLNIKQYRIKCVASMEKNIYHAKNELHLGTSKQSSGLHFSENFAININGNHYNHLFIHFFPVHSFLTFQNSRHDEEDEKMIV